MRLPSKTIERGLFRNGYKRLIAVDEVGMGCLAGPVVVCAALFTPKFFQRSHPQLRWLRDSKLLLPHQRAIFLGQLLREKEIRFQVSYCYPKTIDRMNIYQAARLAMRRAINKLIQDSRFTIHESKILNHKSRAMILVDGPHKIAGLDLEQKPIVKGDRRVFAIACASIIAKVFRDRMMARYAKRFPGYAFDRHKGYSTVLHRIRLAELGPCAIHRRSFAPVAKLV